MTRVASVFYLIVYQNPCLTPLMIWAWEWDLCKSSSFIIIRWKKYVFKLVRCTVDGSGLWLLAPTVVSTGSYDYTFCLRAHYWVLSLPCLLLVHTDLGISRVRLPCIVERLTVSGLHSNCVSALASGTGFCMSPWHINTAGERRE